MSAMYYKVNYLDENENMTGLDEDFNSKADAEDAADQLRDDGYAGVTVIGLRDYAGDIR